MLMKKNIISKKQQPTEKRAFTRRDFLSTSMKVGAAAFTTSFLPTLHASADERYNVLFIMADDLGILLGCYGHPEMHTPNIDKIADQGVVFDRAYCQYPLCGPSRASLLTGLRPDTTGIMDNWPSPEDRLPGITIPQHFKEQGYHTRSVGKIAHSWYAWTDRVSWSKPIWKLSFEDEYFGAKPKDWKVLDAADDELRDGKAAREAVKVMNEIKELPFFLAVGFDRPHTPFHAPRKYFDLYSPEDFTLPTHSSLPENAPLFSISSEPSRYSDEITLQFLHAYAACISYIDAQVGLLLEQLEKLELAEKTIIVLMGDHGYHIGEHARWEKDTLFEVGVRSPLIVSVPGQSHVGVTTDALVELVDIFPTLCDACELPIPSELEGQSFVPVIEEPTRQWKSAAFSQLRRTNAETWYKRYSLSSLTEIEIAENDSVDGYSMRTERYRYTEWRAYSEHGEKLADVGVELYDYQTDPDETVNIANLPENAELVAQLSKQLQLGWQHALPGMQEGGTTVSSNFPWDINGDGIVDIQDLLLVSENFGIAIQEYPKVDVNQNGSVDIIDLLLVAAHLGESNNPSAPRAHTEILPEHFDILQERLSEARLADDGSALFHKGISVLETLLNAAIPKKTVLLPNYPNPFNPETWIPYDLAQDADVKIHIYDLNGKSIHQLSLGFQTAGTYHSQSRAAYWDGRNSAGEYVSSGIYFFTLYAGQIQTTRKMVVRK